MHEYTEAQIAMHEAGWKLSAEYMQYGPDLPVGYRFDTTRPRWGEYSHAHTRPNLMLEDMPSNKRRRMHGSGESILFDYDY